MSKIVKQLLSVVLTLALLINLLPLQCFSAEVFSKENAANASATVAVTPYERLETAQIIEEDTTKRNEYYKEFVLNNGLRMAAMYAEPVHYEDGGQWKDIDNTLKAFGTAYTNTAGPWEVSFPQQLTKNNAVTITKDGYTLSFFMAGELRSGFGNLEVASLSAAGGIETFSIQNIQASSAQVEKIDLSSVKEGMEHPQIVPEKNHSRLQYNNVYSGTNIVYDLTSNQVKESIVMQSYSANLRGYRYTLNVGDLKPVLTDSGEIHLYDKTEQEIIMVMPAPFLVDDAGEYCYDVSVTLNGSGSTYTLTYLLPQNWLSSSERQWPVVLDPVVSANIDRTNIRDVSVYEQNCPHDNNAGVLDVGHNTDYGIMRSFLKYDQLPALTSADVIVDAVLALVKPNDNSKVNAIEIHKVLENWESESMTWANQPDFDSKVVDHAVVQNTGEYFWNITDIVREWYEGENTGLMLKAPNWVENTTSTESYRKQFYSSDYSAYMRPILTITFRNNNGLEDYWDFTASSAGRAGTGYINNYTGNLVWVHSDIGYGGNRMPVSISHIYNANDATLPQNKRNLFGMGNGWRTNYNQSVSKCELNQIQNGEEVKVPYYVWDDSDGTKHYFYQTEDNDDVYQDEDGLDLTLTLTGNGLACKITDKYGAASYFDSIGRLYKLENNQATKSSIQITYTSSSSKLISTIKDGVGRVYRFSYSNNLLNKISYTGTGTAEIGYVTFGYTGSNLTKITAQDGKQVVYGYNTSNNLLTSAQDIDGYRLQYTYYTIAESYQPYRVKTVSESDGAAGGSLTFEYSHNQTTFTDHKNIAQVMQFNNWGNTVSIQDSEGRAQFASYSSDDEQTAKGNQLTAASKLQNTVGNMLKDSSFENGVAWTGINGVSQSISTDEAYYGSNSVRVRKLSTAEYCGIGTGSFAVKPGESYTFSAYVKTSSGASAYLAFSVSGATVAASETLPANSGWTRLEVTYTNNTASTTTIRVNLYTKDTGYIYMDCAQLEKAETASRYNIIENGDFRYGNYNWIKSEYCGSTEIPVTAVSSAAPQLEKAAFKIEGDPEHKLRIRQEVPVSGVKGDTFVLAGWARGDGVPLTKYTDDVRTFTIRGTFMNTDGTTDEFNFNFNPDTDSAMDWQYAAGVMVAKKPFSGIKVQVLYDFGANTILFDGIQLYKEEFGSSYTYDDDGNVKSVKDIQGKITEYVYDETTNVDLMKIIQNNKAKVSYTYDSYHNVKTATTQEGVGYTFTYDKYGNNTAVSIQSGTSKITSTATYSSDGNRLVSTTDAVGNTTTYSYNANTNVLEWVQYPDDTEATRTNYTYDSMYRIASVSANVDGLSEGTALTATYGYTDDMLTSIKTESTTYTFAYGNFALRSSIKIGSRTLASYSYTSKDNYLSALDYGNGDKVQYSYDKYGRLVTQLYEDGETVTYRYDNSGGLAAVTDSATDITTKYYYDFTDRLMKYAETGTDYSHSTAYTYDDLNNLTSRKQVTNGDVFTTNYTYDDDNRLSTVANGNTTRAYTYDDYARICQQKTSVQGTPILTENFTFHSGTGGASGQIKKYTSTYTGGSLAYTYDDNGNIASVSDGTATTSYVYDTLNQLVRENNQAAGKTWTWTYDNAGNITSRREYAYTTGTLGTPLDTAAYGYDDADWGDLLTSYDGTTITHDTIGNPLNDGTWTYTWEHGRQLAAMTNGTTTWDMTYNADGLRTGRTNGTNEYTYWYNESGQLVRLKYGPLILRLTYGNDGRPISISYNGNTYYYVLNQQGDVMALLDSSGNWVVKYTYDAWGNILTTTGSTTTMYYTLAQYNPLRYRGYVYDRETKLYYLQSRYYNPEIGRFINADSAISDAGGEILGYNQFAYCFNNPVNMTDSTGNWPSWSTILKAATVVVATVAVVAAVAVTVATCGATSIAATIAISSAITIAAKATEVAVLQGKKSASEGKDTGQVATDIVDSVFDNGGKIIGTTPVTKTAGYATGFYSQSSTFQDVLELQKLDGLNVKTMAEAAKYEVVNRFTNFNSCISANASRGSMLISYGFAAYSVGTTLISVFSDDPVQRAANRGYALK